MTEEQSGFGSRLRHYREAAGLSQDDLAERAGLTTSAIGALERGERRRPFPHTVQALAAALQLNEACRADLIAAVPRRRKSSPQNANEPGPATSWPGGDEDRAPLRPDPNTATRPVKASSARAGGLFVGRQAELAALGAGLNDAFAGRGGIVMLVGEAGIGKTSLAREFAVEAASRGSAVLSGCCFEGDWQPPYGPWVEALNAYVLAANPDDVRRDLGQAASPIAQTVPAIRALWPELPLPSPLGADEERFRLYDAVVRFLLAISTARPVLVILDDLHWADPDSLRLLRYLARLLPQSRILVVGAYRDPEFGLNEEHPLVGTLTVLRRESAYQRIAIRGFSRDEVGEYLAMAAGQPLPQTIVKAIGDETNGNPFYAREVFRHLTEEAKVLRRGGQWSGDVSIEHLGIPEGVRQVVGRRVSRLSQQTGALLRLATGFTAGFSFDVLQALSELPEQALLNCIDEALQAGLIRSSGRVPPRYEFAHAIVRHTLYDAQNPDRRARLHRRIALALEQIRGDVSPDHDAELAAQYHASAAVPGAHKGVTHALRAADHARATHAQEREVAFLRMARDLAEESPTPDRAEILRRLAIAEAEAVKLAPAQQSVEEALQAMSAAGVEPRARAEFLAAVARALRDGGADAATWEPLVERGLALAGTARDLLWARLTLLQDRFESIRSGLIGGRFWLGHDRQAVAIARAEGDEEDHARTIEALDCRTREETNRVLALGRSWKCPTAVMRALETAGRDLLYRYGDLRESHTVYEELLTIGERFGSIPAQAEALAHLATSEIIMWDHRRAKETLRRAEETVARLGEAHRMHKFVALSRAILFAYYLDGDWPVLSAAAYDYATSEAARRSSVGAVAAAMSALAFGRSGRVSQARELLANLAAVLERAPLASYAHNVAVAVAAPAVWELDVVELAGSHLRLLLDLRDIGVGDYGFAPPELSMARMSSLLGEVDQAMDYFEQARAKVGAQGYAHMRAIVDYDHARALVRAGNADRAQSASLLEAAMDGFRGHEMLGWLERAAELKKEIGL